jgi:hypothetical protein
VANHNDYSAEELVRNMDAGNVGDTLFEELKKLTTDQRSEIAEVLLEREIKRKTNGISSGLHLA